MQKIFKLINKYNKNYMYNQTEAKALVLKYNKVFAEQGLAMLVKDDFDYLDFQVKVSSYENMEAIKAKFFEIKEDLREIWNVIAYKEKHFLLYQELDKLTDKLPAFMVDDKRMFISFFEPLINAYYNHDMLMFDNENYRKYLYNYKPLVIDNQYGIKPLEAGFAKIDYLLSNDHAYVIFKADIKRFYLVDHRDQENVIKDSFGLGYHINERQVRKLAEILLDFDAYEFMTYLVNEKIVAKRLAKKLSRSLKSYGGFNDETK
ncbi:MAG: hypothetical protein GX074_01660 [Erysipelothrix sp.]|nr:hypothetical protein [Erysipelothrix sp.]